jgi:hypothetical protein
MLGSFPSLSPDVFICYVKTESAKEKASQRETRGLAQPSALQSLNISDISCPFPQIAMVFMKLN